MQSHDWICSSTWCGDFDRRNRRQRAVRQSDTDRRKFAPARLEVPEPVPLEYAAARGRRPLLQLPGRSVTAEADLELFDFLRTEPLRPEQFALLRAGIGPADRCYAAWSFVLGRKAEMLPVPLLQQCPLRSR